MCAESRDISAALAWTFLEFFASKVLSGIFEEGTFFGEVMLGIMRTSVKHAESARDEAAGDESSSTVSILLNSFSPQLFWILPNRCNRP